ncbi:ROK family transcriptional regulator [soil metagenome]
MTLRGTNQESGRPYNRRIVLETIRLYAPISRGDIAKRVGLTVQTVSNIIRELELQGFLTAEREAPKGRGYPATSLAINPEGGFAIGLNVTPMGIDAALVNLGGVILHRGRRDIAHAAPDRAFADIAELAEEMKALKPRNRILGTGLAMPGPFDVESMSFVGPTTLQGWKGVAVRDRLAHATGLPAFTDVDVAAAALGERLYGAGRALHDFYYLYLGVGLGGTMVHDGRALRGAHGNAGEIGHLPVVPDGEACACGNRGCLERYLSLEARDRRLPGVGEEGWIAEVTPLFRAAVVTVENLFDPETIILGGLADARLLERLIEAAQPLPHSVAERRGRTMARLIPSAAGADAVLRGAAALAISGLLAPRMDAAEASDPLMAGHAA